MKWEDSTVGEVRPDHRIRRIEPRMGSVVPGYQHRRSLVDGRKELTYKLPRVASSYVSAKNFRKGQEGCVGIVKNRQQNSGWLYQQSRRDSIQGTSLSDPRPVDVVPEEEHSHPSTTPTRGTELHSRLGIEIHERSIGLETGPINLSENRRELRPTGSGPTCICIKANQSVPSLLRLAARSICRGNGCLHPGLDIHEGLCQSSMEPDTPGPDKNTDTKGRRGSSSSSMEGTTLVCPPFINVSGLATPSTQTINHRVTVIRPSTGRMEHLRERLSSQGFSGQATELVLKSWRSKTNKSYDSLFRQWNHWCIERD